MQNINLLCLQGKVFHSLLIKIYFHLSNRQNKHLCMSDRQLRGEEVEEEWRRAKRCRDITVTDIKPNVRDTQYTLNLYLPLWEVRARILRAADATRYKDDCRIWWRWKEVEEGGNKVHEARERAGFIVSRSNL